MGRGDIRVVSGGLGAREFDVDDRDTSANKALVFGEPVKRGGAGSNFLVSIQDGDPEIGTDCLIGVMNRDSTETASVDGKGEVLMATGGTILYGNANTAGNVDSASELLGIMLDQVAFDVSAASVYTIDENEGSDSNVHGLTIVGGDIIRSNLFVMVQVNATIVGSLVGQTMD